MNYVHGALVAVPLRRLMCACYFVPQIAKYKEEAEKRSAEANAQLTRLVSRHMQNIMVLMSN